MRMRRFEISQVWLGFFSPGWVLMPFSYFIFYGIFLVSERRRCLHGVIIHLDTRYYQ